MHEQKKVESKDLNIAASPGGVRAHDLILATERSLVGFRPEKADHAIGGERSPKKCQDVHRKEGNDQDSMYNVNT